MISKFNEYVPVFAKVLFLNFDISAVSRPGTEDEFSDGYKRTPPLYKKLGRSKGLNVDFKEYSDILVVDNKCIEIDKIPLKSYDFVMLGLMAKKTEIANLVVNYLKTMLSTFHTALPVIVGIRLLICTICLVQDYRTSHLL